MAQILIVEDNKDLNAVYRLILERNGHQVRTAYDGAEGLQLLANQTPDIILLDLIMPRKNGVEFLQEADLPKHYPAVKVLVFTNLDHGQEIDAAMVNGAVRYAIKARTTPEGLVTTVEAMLAE